MLQLLNLKTYFQVISPSRHVAYNHPGRAKIFFCLQASDEKHLQQNIFQHRTQPHSVLEMTVTEHIKFSGGRSWTKLNVRRNRGFDSQKVKKFSLRQ